MRNSYEEKSRADRAFLKALKRHEDHKRKKNRMPKLSFEEQEKGMGIKKERLTALYSRHSGPNIIPTLQELAGIFEFYEINIENLFGIKPTDFEPYLLILKGPDAMTFADRYRLGQVCRGLHEKAKKKTIF
jgi:hypothetical protein